MNGVRDVKKEKLLPPEKTRTDKADELFTKRGFWRRAAPQMVGAYVFLVGLGVYSVGRGWEPQTVGTTVAVIFLGLGIPQLIRFHFAARKHSELKLRFGKRYTDLIESGQIVMTPYSVFMFGAPDSAALRRLLKEEAAEQKI